jgi:hypothetical protein
MQSGPLRRAQRLRAISLASPAKKARPYAAERGPTAWHTNEENAEASEEASASSAVANTIEPTILPIPASSTLVAQALLYTRFSGRRLDPWCYCVSRLPASRIPDSPHYLSLAWRLIAGAGPGTRCSAQQRKRARAICIRVEGLVAVAQAREREPIWASPLDVPTRTSVNSGRSSARECLDDHRARVDAVMRVGSASAIADIRGG